MRPLKLTMQAFGPYPNKVEIPFCALGHSNIFLISGNTGSGKTTIFDAVCFALFNNSSGSLRGNSTLRSHFAPDNLKSYVEFEFLSNGEIYKIIRTPQYERKKLKGEGFIKENASAEIYLPDGRIIYGVDEVNKFVIDLLGVNLAQFSQIALLAQGEFIKLLNSSTNERSEIFRNIFNTDNFLVFQNKLKDEFTKYKNLSFDIKKSITQYISQIRTEDIEMLELIKFFNENETFLQSDKLIEKLNDLNIENNKNINKIQKKLVNLNEENKNQYIIHQKILTKNKLLKNKLNIVNEISNQKVLFENAKKEFLTLDEKEKEIQALRFKINEAQEEVIKAKEISKYENEYLKNKEKLENIEIENNSLSNIILNLKTDFLKFKYNTVDKLNKELKSKQEKLNTLKEKYSKDSLSYNQKYDIYLSNQAGILAKNLKQDTPCPVCGAKNHPKPAQITDDNISKEFLDNFKQELDKTCENLNEISLDCSLLIEKIKLKQDEILKYQKENNIKLEKDENIFVKEIDFEKEIKKALEKQEKLSLEISDFKLLLNSLNAKINTLKSQIKEDNIESIMQNFEKLNNNLQNLINLKNEIEKNYNKENLKLSNLISNNELTDKQLNEMKDVDETKIELVENRLYELEKTIDINNNELKKLNLIKGINEDVYKNLCLKSSQFIEIQEKYDTLKLLNDCANGNLKGAKKITFEQYIQGYYLDIVLNEANKILKILTKNQFQFLRNKDTLQTRSKTGLDIEITDFYTYKTRSSKTLSGGETFMAALSLALGLSVAVSNMSGAKNIDALFIDEGFGTLDCESLDLAINKIIDLCLNNRIIGLISHMEELKNKIQNQIQTTKTQNGASLQVNF